MKHRTIVILILALLLIPAAHAQLPTPPFTQPDPNSHNFSDDSAVFSQGGQAKWIYTVTLDNSTAGQLAVEWSEPSQSPDGYTVQWKTGRGRWSSRNTSSTSATITGLTAGRTYRVRVRARYQGEVEGSWSHQVRAVVS